MALAHASMTVKPDKPCPCCEDHYSSTGRMGDTLYAIRLSCCLQFKNVSSQERAELVRTVGGCALCLDWTAGHLREACPYVEQFKVCDMPGCKLMHNHLLHGSNDKFVITIMANGTDLHGDLAAPSSRDVRDPERFWTLL